MYVFYTELAGESKAFEIVESLLERVDLLADKRFVKMGAIDEQFRHLKYEYKKLIEKNVKITYRVSASKPIVYINRVFETRQHPANNK